MLKRREECDTYLTHICKYHYSRERAPWKDIHLQLIKVTVLAESSIYFIFSPGSLRSSNVYGLESIRCHTLPQFHFFIDSSLFNSKLIIMIKIILKWRKESNTNLTYVCRHHWSRQITMNEDLFEAFSQHCGFHPLYR